MGTGISAGALSAGQMVELISRLASSSGSGLHSPQQQRSSVLAHSALSTLHQPSAQDDTVWVRELASKLTYERLRHLAPNQLASVLAAFASLRYDPGEEFFLDFDLACYSHPGPFDAQSTAEVLNALAVLRAQKGTVPTTLSFPAVVGVAGGGESVFACLLTRTTWRPPEPMTPLHRAALSPRALPLPPPS